MHDDTKSLTIILPRLTAELDRLRESMVDFYTRRGIDTDIVARIELAAYEAVANIMEHASPACRDLDITVECAITDIEVRVTVSNYGDRFDATAAELPDVETHYRLGKKRGLGIFFIRTLMDRVEYAYRDGLNRLTMAIQR